MNEQVQSVIRHILAALGGYLVIKGLDSSLIETGGGIVATIIALVWSFKAKSATQSQVAGVLRQVVTFIGGIFIAKGKLSPEQLETYLGVIAALVPILLAKLDKDSTPTTPQ
jgi:hypothetical protein